MRTVRSRRRVMTTARSAIVLMSCVFVTVVAVPAHAQSANVENTSEDLEPRTIGTGGTTLIGIAGYVDTFFSSAQDVPATYTLHVDLTYFLTNRFVVRGGLAGTGAFGGDDDERQAGIGVPALHAIVGSLIYFTPQSLLSLYSGIDYWAQLTQRSGPDAGSLIGTLGVQGALSSRASVYVEGGYGIGLSKGEDDETLTRLVGRVGVRLKF